MVGEIIPKKFKIYKKYKNLPANGDPNSISIFIAELLYISWPSLKGEIKFGTPLNSLIGVAELNFIFLYTYLDGFVCL